MNGCTPGLKLRVRTQNHWNWHPPQPRINISAFLETELYRTMTNWQGQQFQIWDVESSKPVDIKCRRVRVGSMSKYWLNTSLSDFFFMCILINTVVTFWIIDYNFANTCQIASVVSPTDRPRSVRNRCVIELFVALFVLSLCPFGISVGIGAFVIGMSQISFLNFKIQISKFQISKFRISKLQL